MATQQMLAARCPDDWVKQVNRIAEVTGRTSADVVREALGQYLGATELRDLQCAMAALEQRMGQLERSQQVKPHAN